ncbi:MAG TPA: glutathione S-transferase family protein [Vicinamibacterales bacterium]|nr:glutathione S-transferase family protein [Vicinamibacterales bacterium]
MTPTLFGSRLSPFVEKVVRALALKDMHFTLVEPKSPADFKRWNPQTGKMPVLELDGERVWDSTRILARLDALRPDRPLYDPDPAVAARQRFLEDWSDESLYWYVMGLRWNETNAAASAAQVAASLPVPAVVRTAIRPILHWQIGGQAKAQGLQRLPLTVLVEELGRRFDELLVWLGDRPFLFAERPSGADLAIFGQLSTLRSGPTPQGAALVDARPALGAWMSRVAQETPVRTD